MPVYNLTSTCKDERSAPNADSRATAVDDVSPLIVYSTGWGDSSHTDSLWSSYTHGTFHATEQQVCPLDLGSLHATTKLRSTRLQNATASLTFNGSAVYLYGAKRDNHVRRDP